RRRRPRSQVRARRFRGLRQRAGAPHLHPRRSRRCLTVSATRPAPRPGATSGYLPVNGLDMYYEIHGGGSPLALMHGAMGTIESCFADLLPALAATRQVVAIELQGHGHTADDDRPLSYHQIAADAAAQLEWPGIGIAEPVRSR